MRKVSIKLSNRIESIKQKLARKNEVYKPSIFWRDLYKKFYKILKANNLKNFRNNKLANNFFVPLYHLNREFGANKLLTLVKKKKISKRLSFEIKNILSGYSLAEKDFKTFKLADNVKKKPYLHKFSESKYGNPAEHFKFEKKYFSRSALNYLKGLVFLKKKTKKFIPKIVLEIGGGYGTLAEIFKYSGIKNFKYINVDLPPISILSEIYLTRVFKIKNISQINNSLDNSININKLKTITCLNSWQINNLKGKIDLFVNFVSFQEMEPNIVKNYLAKVCNLKPNFILMRNLREGKQKYSKNAVGVKKPILSSDYTRFLSKKYSLIEKNTEPFGYKTHDNYHSEILLFKKK